MRSHEGGDIRRSLRGRLQLVVYILFISLISIRGRLLYRLKKKEGKEMETEENTQAAWKVSRYTTTGDPGPGFLRLPLS